MRQSKVWRHRYDRFAFDGQAAVVNLDVQLLPRYARQVGQQCDRVSVLIDVDRVSVTRRWASSASWRLKALPSRWASCMLSLMMSPH